jgi:hypothetical protein
MVLNLPTGEPLLFAALAPELRRLDTQTRTTILSFYTVFGSMKSHTRSLPDIVNQKDDTTAQFVHDIIRGWRRVASATSAALSHINEKYRAELPAHERQYLNQVSEVLAAVTAGKADDPDELAMRLANLP